MDFLIECAKIELELLLFVKILHNELENGILLELPLDVPIP